MHSHDRPIHLFRETNNTFRVFSRLVVAALPQGPLLDARELHGFEDSLYACTRTCEDSLCCSSSASCRRHNELWDSYVDSQVHRTRGSDG
jgi:hypothetical protein